MSRAQGSLSQQERGAIFVMALPIVLLLIGMLYYAIGIGDAIIRRETLQDAADASAFSSAVMMARGMNVIVLINVLMAMLVAVLVMIRVVQIAVLLGISLCTLLAWPTGGVTLQAIPSLRLAQAETDAAYAWARGVVKPLVEGLHVTSRVIKYAMPVAMEARVVDTSQQYAPHASFGFAIPNQWSLPIEPGTEGQLCAKAGEYAAEIGTYPLRPLLPEVVRENIGDAFSAATGALASYFCSFSGGNPPAIELPGEELKQELPKLPKAKDCEDFRARNESEQREHQRICDEAYAELQAATPHPITGECNHPDCSAYELRAELARSECQAPGRPRFHQWSWIERTVHLRAQLNGDGPARQDPREAPRVDFSGRRRQPQNPHARAPYPNLIEHEEPEFGDWRLETGAKPPCGPEGTRAKGWNPAASESLCVSDFEPLHPEGPQRVPDPLLETSYIEVRHVLGCSRMVERITPNAQNTPVGQSGSPLSTCDGEPSARVHHNVKTCAQLGDETFQLRTVLIAKDSSDSARKVLDTMVLREKGSQAPWQGADVGDGLQQLSRVFVAQAEYYFDHDGVSEVARDRLEWMWTMDWRARLVRFRLPDDQSPDGCGEQSNGSGANRRNPSSSRCGVALPSPDVTRACELANGSELCSTIDATLGALNTLIVH